MSLEVRLVRENVFADSVDVKRVARELMRLTNADGFAPPRDMSQALEVMARLLGFPDNFALRQTARKHVDSPPEGPHALKPVGTLVRSYADERAEHMIQLLKQFREGSSIGLPIVELVSPGTPFPSGLPSKFDRHWQDSAVHLMKQALAGCNTEKVELVLIAGQSSAGKTLLARQTAHTQKGLVLNYALDTMNDSGRTAALHQNPPLVCYDAGEWDAEYLYRRIADFRSMAHLPAYGHPDHPDAALASQLFGYNHHESCILQQVLSKPGFVAVICVQDLPSAINQCFGVSASGSTLLDGLRVVNLDSMTFELVGSPNPRPEPGNRKPKGPFVSQLG